MTRSITNCHFCQTPLFDGEECNCDKATIQRLKTDLRELGQIVAMLAILPDTELATVAAMLMKADQIFAASRLLQMLPDERQDRIRDLMVNNNE